MQIESFYHGTRNNWAYAYDKKDFHLRFRTKRNDVERILVRTGDKYDWERNHVDYVMYLVSTDTYFDYWEVSVNPKFKRFSYFFRLQSGEEIVWVTETAVLTEEPHAPDGYYDLPYIHNIEIFKVPDWAKEAIFYQIFIERFANGNSENDPKGVQKWGGVPTADNYFGGDLYGVLDKLDYLVDLVINAIYFTPLFEAISYHKYDTVDYKKVDSHFGDNY